MSGVKPDPPTPSTALAMWIRPFTPDINTARPLRLSLQHLLQAFAELLLAERFGQNARQVNSGRR